MGLENEKHSPRTQEIHITLIRDAGKEIVNCNSVKCAYLFLFVGCVCACVDRSSSTKNVTPLAGRRVIRFTLEAEKRFITLSRGGHGRFSTGGYHVVSLEFQVLPKNGAEGGVAATVGQEPAPIKGRPQCFLGPQGYLLMFANA